VVDGPFHPAYREMVETALWYKAIVNKIKKLNVKVMQVEVKVNPLDVNNVIGYKNENIENLKKVYDVELIVTPDENLKQGKSKIEITKTYKDFKE
jgi:flagellar biosynthesis/type III secretory pathway protein FliH